MEGKCDSYLAYITLDFREAKSLEQPAKLFPDSMEEKGMLPLRQILITFSLHFILLLTASEGENWLQGLKPITPLYLNLTLKLTYPQQSTASFVWERINFPMCSSECCPSGTTAAKCWKTCHRLSHMVSSTGTCAA